MQISLSLMLVLITLWTSDSRPYYNHGHPGFSGDFSKFAKIKDLIDRINIKKFRAAYDILESEHVAEEDIVKIDLTEEAINEERVTQEVPEPEAAAEETTVAAKTAAEETIVAVTEAVAADNDVTTAAPAEEEITTAATKIAEEEAGDEASAKTEAAAADVPDDSENEILDEFFVSEDTLQAAQKYGYKILLKKINGANVPVGQIKFKFPTYIEVEVTDAVESTTLAAAVDAKAADEATTAAAIAAAVDTTAAPAASADETTLAAVADAKAAGETTTAAAVVADETTVSAQIAEETTAAVAEETTTALAIVAPRVTAAVIPEIDEISSETVNKGTDQVVKDTEIAVAALEETKDEVEISADCSVSLQEFKGLVIDLARKVKDSTPLLHEIVTIGKGLKGITDTAALLRSGGQLLKLLEPFLENILPSTENASCGGPNAMLISMSNVATEVDVVANTIENQENGKSPVLREAATSLQLAAWILAQLQKSVHSFYDKNGICNENENASTAAILRSLAKTMASYEPMLGMLGPESSVEDLQETVEAINKAVTILDTLNPEAEGLPGVSCKASLTEMGDSLQNLARFVTNIGNIQV